MNTERRQEKEAKKYKTKQPMSPSSNGSILDGPYRQYNPFVKSMSSQRKDFDWVSNMRKEVIQIVEPYRARVLTYEERIKNLEQVSINLQH